MQLKAWYGPAPLLHPDWSLDGRWLRAVRFEAKSLIGAIRQAEDAYRRVRPDTQVELANDKADYRAAIDDFIAKKSNVLKLLPMCPKR